MSFLGWVALCGALLLFIALSSAYLRRLPVTTAIVYVGVGVAMGPSGLNWLPIYIDRGDAWLERITEIAVVLSLFVGGLKLRAPVRPQPGERPGGSLAP